MISQTMSVPVYVYDNGILVFKFESTSGQNNNATIGTGIDLKTIRMLISSGLPYLGRFTLTRIPFMPEDEKFVNELFMVQVKELITNHKLVVPVRRGRPKSTTPALTIQRVSDGIIYNFDNVRSAPTWLSKVEGQQVHQDTILRRLQSGNIEPHRDSYIDRKSVV